MPVLAGMEQPAPAPTAGDPASKYIFNVVMNPQQPETLPLKGVSFQSPGSMLSAVPAPGAVRDTSCSGSGYYLTGGSYADDLPSVNVARVGDEGQSGEYSPNWMADNGEFAYAIYRWNLRGYTGAQTVGFTWQDGFAPVNQLDFWIGLGDVGGDRWDWYLGPMDQVLTIDSFGPYREASGEMLMIVLLKGTVQVVLDSMEAGVPEQRATGETDDLPGDVPEYPLLGVTGSLPLMVDLSAECAPINDQLTWGACTAFAVGDGAFNFELNRVYGPLGWNLTNSKFRASPKYLYITSGTKYSYPVGPGVGRWTEDVIRTLRFDGVATELHAPYDLVYAENWGSEATADADVLTCDDWVEIPCNTWEGIATVKSVLAILRKPLAMRIYLDDSFFMYAGVGEWYPLGMSVGGHAMCIVGYDDARGPDGAFKVRNSWSEQWGDAGHVWIDYRAFLLSSTSVRTWTVDEDYRAGVVARFNLTPPGIPPVTTVDASDGTSAEFIEVTWWPRTDVGTFSVFRDDQTALVSTVPGTESAWQDTSITDNYGHIYWVQADSSALSAPDVGHLAAIPEVLSVEPGGGTEGDSVSFVVGGTGSGPLYYDWDFGGGAIPNTSSDSRPEITLGVPGSYAASITIHNSLGEDTFNFELVVTGILPRISYILGKSGFSSDFTTLSAGTNGTPDSYLWSFTGGATPPSSTAAEPVVTLGAPGIYDASLRVTNDAGFDIYYFELAVLDATATAWPHSGHDVRQSAQSPVIGPQSPNLKWKYFGGIPTNHQPDIGSVIVLADNTLIVPTRTPNDGASLRRLNPDGTCIWMHQETGHPAYYGSPMVGQHSGDLYAMYNSAVRKYDPLDGSVIWSYAHDTLGVKTLFEGDNGLLYIVLGGRYLSAVHIADGTAAMEPFELTDKHNSVRQAILAPNGIMFISAEAWSGNRFVAFDTSTGLPAGSGWAMYTIESMTISADGRTLFYANEEGTTVAMDTTTCQRLWEQRDTRGRRAVVGVRADGTLYVYNRLGILHSLNPETGEILWEYDLGDEGDWPVALAIGRDGTAYCGGPGRQVFAVRDGALVWASPEPGPGYFIGTPIIGVDGTLYCGSSGGWLYAIGAGTGEEYLPPQVTEVSPLQGAAGAEVTFNATVLGNAPLTYSWDFGGGATPPTSTDASPTVTLGDSGIYDMTLVATNAYGHYEHFCSFEVEAAPISWQIHEVNSTGYGDLGLAEVNGRLGITVRISDEDKDMYYIYPTVDVPTQTSDWVITRIEDNQTTTTPHGGRLFEYNGKPVAFWREWDGLRYAIASTAVPTSESDWAASWVTDRLQLAGVNAAPLLIEGKLAVIHGAVDWDDVTGSYVIASYAKVAEPAGEEDWTHTIAAMESYLSFRSGLIDDTGRPGFILYRADECHYYTSDLVKPLSEADWDTHSLSGYEDLIRFGENSTIAPVSGRQSAAYSRNQNGEYSLWYGRSTIEHPTQTTDWNRHMITDDTPYGWGKVGTVNGLPAVLYRSPDPWALRIAVAKVAEPSVDNDWNRTDVDTTAHVNGGSWEMIEFGGVAYIAYLHGVTKKLMLAVYDY